MFATKNVTESDLKQIAGFESQGKLVVSLYLNVDGSRYPRIQDYEKELHGLMRKAEHDWLRNGEIPKPKKQALKKNLGKVDSYVTGEWRRHGTKGLVIFSCLEADFWQVHELPVGLRSSLIIGDEPHAKELVALINESKRFCVVSVSRKKARFFTVGLNEIEEHQGVLIDELVPDQVKEGEWASLRQSRIARHIEDHVLHHLKDIARLTYNFFVQHDIDRLILAGHKELIPRFKAVLHPYLQERVAGEFNAEPDVPLSEILKRSLLVEKEIQLSDENNLFKKLRDENRKGGLAVIGLRPTIEALMRGQADTLVIGDGQPQLGYVCYKDHYLSVGPGDCPVCGDALNESRDVIEDMVHLAINQNVQIEHLTHIDEFRKKDKYGALLRFGL